MTINFETASYDEIRASNCPHCSIGLDNGLLHVDDESANDNKTYREIKDTGFEAGEYNCMGCDGFFGKPVVFEGKAPKAKKPHQGGKGIKIQKVRLTRNGVTRPSEGGVCGDIWAVLDQAQSPTSKTVQALAELAGWNKSTASVQYNAWKKFNA